MVSILEHVQGLTRLKKGLCLEDLRIYMGMPSIILYSKEGSSYSKLSGQGVVSSTGSSSSDWAHNTGGIRLDTRYILKGTMFTEDPAFFAMVDNEKSVFISLDLKD